jgi:hypothetical protein
MPALPSGDVSHTGAPALQPMGMPELDGRASRADGLLRQCFLPRRVLPVIQACYVFT